MAQVGDKIMLGTVETTCISVEHLERECHGSEILYAKHLRSMHDVVILKYDVPDFKGTDTVKLVSDSVVLYDYTTGVRWTVYANYTLTIIDEFIVKGVTESGLERSARLADEAKRGAVESTRDGN